MILLEEKFEFSIPEVDYSKSRKTFSRCYVCFKQQTGGKWTLTSQGGIRITESQFAFASAMLGAALNCGNPDRSLHGTGD